MSALVDHRARRRLVVERAIRLFARVGYEAVTFQMISANCGVSRTVLYRYFRDKRQIFDSAISEIIGRIAVRHSEIVRSADGAAARLRRLSGSVTAMLFDNREFLSVIIDFVMTQRRAGYDMSRRIMRFTIFLKRIIHTIVLQGVRNGEFRADVNADVYTDMFYAQFESAVLRLTVSDDAVQTDVLDRIEAIVGAMSKRP